MAIDTDQLQSAVSHGPAGLRELGRSLAGAGNAAGLVHAAQWLGDHAPSGLAAPYRAAFLGLAKHHGDAIAAYEGWLDEAEAPDAWHLGQLCKSYRKLADGAGVWRTAARFHPWDLAVDPRIAAAQCLAAVAKPAGVAPRTLKVAVLATFTPTAVVPCLRVAAIRLGLDLDLWIADFDQLRAQIVDPGSALYRHDPDLVILATTWRDLRPGAVAADQAAEWVQLWDVMLARTRAQVLQHTFDRPQTSPHGHLDLRDPLSLRRIAGDVNAALATAAPPRVTLVDYEHAAYRYGGDGWTDPRQWHWAKEAVSPRAAPWLAEEYVAILRAYTGQTKKMLVLDLDNTLWGGVVGEVGVGGLQIGPPSVEGEAHQALQQYAKALAGRGILLSVCTKNNRDDALAPFQQVADMVLRFEDFTSFDTGWDPKPQRLRRVALGLNLGLDSFVFVDDNPAERAFMRRECPGVLTIPLGDDPSGYVTALDRARAFEVLAVSPDDLQRAASYKTEREREDLRFSLADTASYYASLEMIGTIAPFSAPDHARIVQLAGRSNQFNLTTWRLTQAEVEHLTTSPDHVALTLRLRDRFGDYGLVLVLITEVVGDELDVRALFMSCRVIARSVEQLALAELDRIAIARGCATIRGTYLPTPKNRELVSELYGKLGFTRIEARDDGSTVWRRTVDPANPATNPHIRVERPV
ncbi:MAG: HAD-IIIC family phosphatase [Myxococcota bacterium]